MQASSETAINSNAPDKYTELLSFEMEVTNILQTKTYELTEEETPLIIKNWLVREGLHLLLTFTNSEKKAYKTVDGLLSTLGKKFKQHHNKMVLSIQFHHLKRKSREYTKEWKGRLQIKATDSKYQEYERRLKKTIHGLNNDTIISEITRKLTAFKDTSEVSSFNVGTEHRGTESAEGSVGEYQRCESLTQERWAKA